MVTSDRRSGSRDGGRMPRIQSTVSKRREPYHGASYRQGHKREKAPPIDTQDTNLIKVSAESETKSVAGKIAYDCREKGEAPTVLTIGPQSINIALKAISVARKWLLADGGDLSCQPAFREGMSDLALAIYVTRCKAGSLGGGHDDASELNVKAATKRHALAGAIAARAREDEACCLIAKGADAVAAALSAICRARSYLEENQLDLHCYPKFFTKENDGETSTYMRIDLRSEPV